MAKRRKLEDPNWAKWQVFCGGAPVGSRVLAVSAKQAIHIKRNRQTGIVLYGAWTARKTSLTIEESETLAEFEAISPETMLCSGCGYPDPSPGAGNCPSCETLYQENPG